jgi:hypothetical protein
MAAIVTTTYSPSLLIMDSPALAGGGGGAVVAPAQLRLNVGVFEHGHPRMVEPLLLLVVAVPEIVVQAAKSKISLVSYCPVSFSFQ